MTGNGILQFLTYLFIILLLVKPLGSYLAAVYEGKPSGLYRVIGPLERLIYRIVGIHPEFEMSWRRYLSAMLWFNFIGMLMIYLIERCQSFLPLNPQLLSSVSPDLAFNTAASFATNTNWQAYSGETTMSYLTQMLGLTVQNFLSAATGMALVIALIRGLSKNEGNTLGNFWVDATRGILYILLPLSIILAVALTSQGVVQTVKPYATIKLLEPLRYETAQHSDPSITQKTTVITEQTIPLGPVASQVAIKQLGTNGGGFFHANAAHPFENPTPLSNLLEMLAILLIPAAFCYAFGVMVNDRRQGLAILATMLILYIPFASITIMVEQKGNPLLSSLSIQQQPISKFYPGGNMEGKETRFGIVNSSIWATATTAASNGSVNATLDSFIPLGGMMPLWLMHLGEVVFGGVGSGLYGMLMMVILTVFIAGLMVGRTPEYLGKKIEVYEIKMAAIAVLIMPLFVLILTATAIMTDTLAKGILENVGAHHFEEILYAFTSMVNNNGSSFAGLNANTPFYNIVGGLAILIGRYWIAIPTLALAGSMVRKKIIPVNLGTLPTHTLLFIFLLVGVVIILGALTFFPALALGPIVEQLIMWGK